MFQWWDSLMSFVREYPALFLSCAVLFFIFWVIMIIRKMKLVKEFDIFFDQKNEAISAVRNCSWKKSRLIQLLALAAKGDGNSSHNPRAYVSGQSPHIGGEYREIDDQELARLADQTVTAGFWGLIVNSLDLLWSIRHVRFLLQQAEEAVNNGYHGNHPGGITFDVSDIAEEYHKHLNTMRHVLTLAIGEAAAEAFDTYARPLIDPIVLAGHDKQAKAIARRLSLNSCDVDLYDIKQLMAQCQAANLDPLTLIDSRYHDTLRSLIEAVEKVERQNADEKATPEVAQA
ncbi:MAG: hypothetical protein HZC01_04330 [Candidatus Kerfeldbacteria bacterium]|nr:hypothetical protein [Candidatus Kerfeldbacteria bacterium]